MCVPDEFIIFQHLQQQNYHIIFHDNFTAIKILIQRDEIYTYPIVKELHDADNELVHVAGKLTLTVLVVTIDAQWEGMGDVGSARYEPALLPPCPTIRVLSYSN